MIKDLIFVFLNYLTSNGIVELKFFKETYLFILFGLNSIEVYLIYRNF